jgi:hypothetical protein
MYNFVEVSGHNLEVSGHNLEISQTSVLAFYKMLFMNKLEFSSLFYFLYGFLLLNLKSKL